MDTLDDFELTLHQELRAIRAAEGYVMLGLYREACDELKRVDPSRQMLPQPLILKLCAYAGLEQWSRAQQLAKRMANRDPDNAQWYLWWASAACRAQSVEAAAGILVNALRDHPNNANIHYNLSCYENRLHHFRQAQRHLARAIQLDPRLRFVASESDGKDLELLWMGK